MRVTRWFLAIWILAAGAVSGGPARTAGKRLPFKTTPAAARDDADPNVLVHTAWEVCFEGGWTVTAGPSPAASVVIVADRLRVTDAARVSASTESSGVGGTLRIEAVEILVDDGGAIGAESSGSGNAGSIAIVGNRRLEVAGGAIRTEAAAADGGTISIDSSRMVSVVDGAITATLGGGLGGGGNLTIASPDFIVLQRGEIIAKAVGGPGGNIRLETDAFVPSAESMISGSSELGIDGTVEIVSPEADVIGALAALAAGYLQVDSFLPTRCGDRNAGDAGRFLIDGRPGVPLRPVDLPPFSSVRGLPSSPPNAGAAWIGNLPRAER